MAKWRGVRLRWSCQFVSAPESSRCLVASALEFRATRWNDDSSMSVYFAVCSQVHQIRHHGHSTVIIQAASSTVHITAGSQEYGCHSTKASGIHVNPWCSSLFTAFLRSQSQHTLMNSGIRRLLVKSGPLKPVFSIVQLDAFDMHPHAPENKTLLKFQCPLSKMACFNFL